MKKLFTLLLILCVCTCVRAQPSIVLKPGTTDSARWELVYEVNGNPQTARGDYDTITKIIEYGEVLYRSGGFIGNRLVPSFDALITEQVKTFVFTQGPVVDAVRSVIASEMVPYGSFPITKDTVVSYPLIGEYLINGKSCGHNADTMEISISIFNIEQVVWHPKDNALGAQSVMLLGEGVISVYSEEFAEQVTVVQQDSLTWRGANNCVWTKLD